MREIKFRGKSGTQWRYGDLYHNERGELMIYEPKTSGQTLDGKAVDGWRIVVDPETVGQFTGIHDANGYDIYEGDIVKFAKPAYTDAPVVITWEDGAFMVDHDLYLGGRDLSRVTVIGNVHDNPELLEQKP